MILKTTKFNLFNKLQAVVEGARHTGVQNIFRDVNGLLFHFETNKKFKIAGIKPVIASSLSKEERDALRI